jgi:putative protein-disulfide isomerase
MSTYAKEIIAVIDPMCSWCWGFEPELQKLKSAVEADTKFSIIAGGLRGKNSQAWDSNFKNFLATYWNDVQKQTSQEFNFSLLNKQHFDYNTEPSCRAIVCVRELDVSKVFVVLQALQKAFYHDALDITDTEVICDVIELCEINKNDFLTLFNSQKTKDHTVADGYKARSMGANVFPSLVFIDEEGHLSVIKGYRTFETLQKML